MTSIRTLEAKIPVDLYLEIEERVRLGLFSTKSEVVDRALRKSFAEGSRDFLRRLVKNLGVSEKAMVSELKKIRK